MHNNNGNGKKVEPKANTRFFDQERFRIWNIMPNPKLKIKWKFDYKYLKRKQ